MRFLFIILILTNAAWAHKYTDCEITDGFFKNSPNQLHNVRFETVADIFSLTNAKSLNLELDGVPMRFTRLNMEVERQTKMLYIIRKKSAFLRTLNILIDRSPYEAKASSEFKAIIQISQESGAHLSYNLQCSF
ncbi:MAG TPA: hypothetical protein VNJ08_11400 [Bacteriovoracaceae bacterium]|nr:hypothetical protein [Bacteriovoracaceae bacterium]